MNYVPRFYLLSLVVVVLIAGSMASANAGMSVLTQTIPNDPVIQSYDNTRTLTTADIDAMITNLIFFGKYEEALNIAEESILNHLTDPRGYYNKGLALYYLGRYEEAIEAYNWGIMIDPDDKDAIYRDMAIDKLKN